MSLLHRVVRVGQAQEQDLEAVRVSRRDWELAWSVGVCILLAGVLVLGSVWLAQRDEVGMTKQARAARMGEVIVLVGEEWNG